LHVTSYKYTRNLKINNSLLTTQCKCDIVKQNKIMCMNEHFKHSAVKYYMQAFSLVLIALMRPFLLWINNIDIINITKGAPSGGLVAKLLVKYHSWR
jgi:hypothetical protein